MQPKPTSEVSARPIPKAPLVVLSIAGFDPSGGAGVLADLKTLAALGVYGMACITALTVQSSQEIRRVVPVDPDTVRETLDCLAADTRFAAIKVGMLGSGEVATVVLNWLAGLEEVPVVLDPVAKSSSGHHLVDKEGEEILRTGFLRRAQWVTPNLGELAFLAGTDLPRNPAEIEQTAGKLLDMAAGYGNPALKIVVTGGHADQPNDLLFSAARCQWFPGERIQTTSTHGTGCTFSSALAARISLGDDDATAVSAAKSYVSHALAHAYPIGKGNGPLNHFWRNPVR